MARGMLRGAAAAWGGLIVLQALTQKNGADAVGGLMGAVDSIVKRALDPSVPLIPDHSTDGSTPTVGPDGKPDGGKIDGRGRYIPPTDSTIPQPNAPQSHNEAYVPGIPSPTTTTTA